MSATSILPRPALSPLAGPFDSYWERHPELVDEPQFDIRSDTPMLLLPMVSIATLYYTAPALREMRPQTRGIATEASLRLAFWRRVSVRKSAWDIAEEFQSLFFPTGNSGWRRGLEPLRRIPRKGFALLAATDELGLVQWTADVPMQDDPYHFERLRLRDALSRLDAGRRQLPNAGVVSGVE